MAPAPPPAPASSVRHARAPLDAAYRALSAAHPGLPIVVFDTPRAGGGALRMSQLGVRDPLQEALLLCAGHGSPAAAALASRGSPASLPMGVALQVAVPPQEEGGGGMGSGGVGAIEAAWLDAAERTTLAAKGVRGSSSSSSSRARGG